MTQVVAKAGGDKTKPVVSQPGLKKPSTGAGAKDKANDVGTPTGQTPKAGGQKKDIGAAANK